MTPIVIASNRIMPVINQVADDESPPSTTRSMKAPVNPGMIAPGMARKRPHNRANTAAVRFPCIQALTPRSRLGGEPVGSKSDSRSNWMAIPVKDFENSSSSTTRRPPAGSLI